MKKTTKGAIAAGTAAVLLLGGAGTIAYWSDSETLGQGSISSGSLSLTPAAPASWTLNGAPVADPTRVSIVPGDELAYSGSFEIDAVGDNLVGTVEVTGGDAAGTLAPYVQAQPAVTKIGGAVVDEITEANDGDVLEVSVDVDFPYGATADNGSQGKTLDLNELTVTVTQQDATR